MGDITHEHTDAIVNPANVNLAHRGGCSAAISREAGGSLQLDSMNYVNVHGKLPVGSCTFTRSGNLKTK